MVKKTQINPLIKTIEYETGLDWSTLEEIYQFKHSDMAVQPEDARIAALMKKVENSPDAGMEADALLALLKLDASEKAAFDTPSKVQKLIEEAQHRSDNEGKVKR